MPIPWLNRFVCCLIAAACSSCDSSSQPAPVAPLSAPAVHHELAQLLPAARVEGAFLGIDFENPEGRRFLSAGWGPFQRDERGGFAWTQGRNAVVDVPLLRAQPRQLEVDLEWPLRAEALPEQNVLVIWNGGVLGEVVLAPKSSEHFVAEIPTEQQLIGLNRLNIVPAYWLDLKKGEAGSKAGVRVRNLRLSASEDTPSSSDHETAASHGDVLQAPGSVISYSLPMPPNARFRAFLSIDRSGPAGDASVIVRAGNGEQRILGHWSAEKLSAGVPVDLALDDSSSPFASLNLAYSSVGYEATSLLRWSNPRIEGSQAVASEPRDPAKFTRWTGQYNVLLVVFDTLRADYTQPYGATEIRTPVLEELSQGGVTFTDVTANASWTRPSVASLLTAQRPGTHRVTTMRSAVPADAPYLPEVLAAAGYSTLGLINNPQISQESGFARGFESIIDFEVLAPIKENAASPEQHAAQIWDMHIAPFLSRSGDRPFFIYLHEIDPHSPYQPKPPFDTLYDFGYPGHVGSQGSSTLDQLRVLALLDRGETWLGQADLKHLRSQYAGEVSAADAFLGAVLDRFQKKGLTDDTLVLFASDHGEELLDHDHWGHGNTVYQTALQVPLIVSLPGVLPEGSRPGASVQLHDVAPTILDLVGVPTPAAMQGRSLTPLIGNPEGAPPDRPIVSRSLRRNQKEGRWKASFAVRFQNWKLIRNDTGQRRTVEHTFELYDLDRDPQEQVDRWANEPVIGRALEQMLAKVLHDDRNNRRSEVPATEPSPATRDALRSLGYAE